RARWVGPRRPVGATVARPRLLALAHQHILLRMECEQAYERGVTAIAAPGRSRASRHLIVMCHHYRTYVRLCQNLGVNRQGTPRSIEAGERRARLAFRHR